MDHPESELLTVMEVGDLLRVSRQTVYRLRRRGLLRFAMVGGSVRIWRMDAERLLPRLSDR